MTVYNGIRAFEGDFDKAQGQLRTIASGWLIAAVGAVAVITKGEFDPTPFPHEAASMLRAFVLAAASVGIAALWYVDQEVYQKLLHSAFVEGLTMEGRHEYLPAIRTRMFYENRNVSNPLSMFYRVPLWLMCGSAIINVMALAASTSGAISPTASLALVACTAHIAFFVWQSIIASRWAALAIPSGTALRSIELTPASSSGSRSGP